MREVVVCEPVRTAVGGYGGSFKSLSAVDLGVSALRGLLQRSGVDRELIDDVVLGHCYPNSNAPAIGRVVALDAGLPATVGGQQLDRRCGSGLQAVINAILQVGVGANDVVVAGGVESMSNVAFFSTDMRWGAARSGIRVYDGLVQGRVTAGGRSHPVPGGMIETAENLRREYSISRVEQDLLALTSHRRAVAAQESGVFAEEIVPTTLSVRGADTVVDRDEHPRADVSMEALSRLKPLMSAVDPDATVTAGNASGQNDAAALVLVTTRDKADHLGLKAWVRLVSWGLAGVDPRVMGIGPVPATARALHQAGLSLADIDVIELNEAFAAQVIAVTCEWRFTESDLERTNIHGSGVSLGHPVGATGARMLGTMARELDRRGGRFGLTTMCIGGGQGLAAIWERVVA